MTAELQTPGHCQHGFVNEPLMSNPPGVRVFFVRLQASLGSVA